MLRDWSFHHIGLACSSIASEQKTWQSLGYSLASPIYHDSNQGIACCFLEGGGPRLELIEDLPGRQTVSPWIKRGVKFYHYAYEVPHFGDAIAHLKANRAMEITRPMPATAFQGRLITFYLLANRALVELIEGAS